MKSQLSCRLLSNATTDHVDYVLSLKLKVNDFNLKEAGDLDLWNQFTQNPRIFFEKLLIQNLRDGLSVENPEEVKNMQISGFVNSTWLWNAPCIGYLTSLSFHGYALGVCSLANEEISQESVISLPNLKKMYLSPPPKLYFYEDPREYPENSGLMVDFVDNFVKNCAFLLQKIRSESLEIVHFYSIHVSDYEEDILLFDSLCGFIEAHSTTLQELVVQNVNYAAFQSQPYYLHPYLYRSIDSNTPVPTELKSFQLGYVPTIMLKPTHRSFAKHLLMGLRKLEELLILLTQ